MKNRNTLKYTAGLIALGVITTLVACGSKNSDNVPVQPINVNPQCLGCQNLNTTSFFQAESQDTYGMLKFSWSFNGQTMNQGQINPYNQQYNSQYNQQYNQYNPYGTVNSNNIYGGGYANQYSNGVGSPIMSYSGIVAAQGLFSVAQGMSLGYCQLPAGSYTLGTLSPGQWNMGIVSNLRLQAVGPATIILSLTQGQVAAKTGGQLGQTWSEIAPVGRIFGNVMIESVNGYTCSMSVLVQ